MHSPAHNVTKRSSAALGQSWVQLNMRPRSRQSVLSRQGFCSPLAHCHKQNANQAKKQGGQSINKQCEGNWDPQNYETKLLTCQYCWLSIFPPPARPRRVDRTGDVKAGTANLIAIQLLLQSGRTLSHYLGHDVSAEALAARRPRAGRCALCGLWAETERISAGMGNGLGGCQQDRRRRTSLARYRL